MTVALLAIAISWGSMDVRAAWHARVPPAIERAAHLRLIAVDLDVEERVAGLFDPRQLRIGGRSPAMSLRLTGNGEPADARDPVFDDDTGHVRLRLLSAQPLARGEVVLAYAGLAVAEVAIEPDGPRVPIGWQRAIAVKGAGRAPLDGHVRLRVLVEARDWSRVAEPRGLALTYSVAGVEQRADPDHWIELDDALRPLAAPLASRPLIVPIRRFAIEYWPVEGGHPIALAGAPVPSAPLVLSAEAEAALARAQPDLDAAHYRAE